MPKKSFAADATWVLLTSVFAAIISIAGGALLARFIGPDGKGVVTAILVVPTLVSNLLALGLREPIAHLIGKKVFNIKEIIDSAYWFLILSSAAGIIISGIYLVSIGNPEFTPLMSLLALMVVPANATIFLCGGIFLGQGRIGLLNRVVWISEFLRLLAIVGLVWALNLGVTSALVAWLLGLCITASYGVALVRADFKPKRRYIPPVAKKMLGMSGIYTLSILATRLHHSIDIIMMERLSNVTQIGLYAVGLGTVELILHIPSAVGTVLFSRSANAADWVSMAAQVAKLLRVTFLAAWLAGAALYLAAPVMIPLVYGSAFMPSIAITQLLIPGIVGWSISSVINGSMKGHGRAGIGILVTLPGVVINVILNYFLLPKYGAKGAALASVISYNLVAVIWIVVYARLTSLPIREFVRYRKSDFSFIRQLSRRTGSEDCSNRSSG
ncbi:MAG TPA: oligosaccharide flippase family protein [Armatimonadota bacterium]|nr:oligosaccharide flippase family protein [Armatimonadota bacterium]